MSTEKPILDHSEHKRQRTPGRSTSAGSTSTQHRAARRNAVLLAVIDSDLRARSAQADELVKRSSVIVARTREMIYCAREAIERSRVLLDGEHEPAIRTSGKVQF